MAEGPKSSGPAPAGSAASSRSAAPLYGKLNIDTSGGATLQIQDPQGNRQCICLDGGTLKLEVRGPLGQSTIVMTPDSIALNAKDVSIDADTIRLSSRSATSLQSLGQTNLSSVADVTVQTPGHLNMNAMTGIDINTVAMAVNALQNIALQAVGGIGVFGGGSGVQIFGSSVSLTGLKTSIVGMVLELLGYTITVAEPQSGGTSPKAPSDLGGKDGAA